MQDEEATMMGFGSFGGGGFGNDGYLPLDSTPLCRGADKQGLPEYSQHHQKYRLTFIVQQLPTLTLSQVFF